MNVHLACLFLFKNKQITKKIKELIGKKMNSSKFIQ